MTIKDGGPAFPVECSYNHEGKIVGSQTGVASGWETGMSLRDYFAGQALNGMLAHATRYKPPPSDTMMTWHQAIAKEAHEIADAMLAQRSPQESEEVRRD